MGFPMVFPISHGLSDGFPMGFEPPPLINRLWDANSTWPGKHTKSELENGGFIWFYGKIMGIYGDTLW